jgi:phasin
LSTVVVAIVLVSPSRVDARDAAPLLGTFIPIVRSVKGLLNPAASNKPTSTKARQVQSIIFLGSPSVTWAGRLFGSTEISGEKPMNENKNFADKTAKAARETFEKGSAAAEESARGAQQSFSAVAEGIRHFNVRLMEMAQLNTVAALDFAREMSTAKGPAEAAALWSSHTKRQFETLTEQSRELTALAQRIATSSAEPITRSFGNAFKGTT